MFNDELLEEIHEEANRLWPNDFDQYESLMNRCTLSICLEILKRLDILQEKDDTESLESAVQKGKVKEEAVYLLHKILFILCEEKVLEKSKGQYVRKKTIDIESPPEILVELSSRYPEERASLKWLSRAYGGVIDVLQGKVYPEDVMFPWGSLDLVEELYDTSEIYGFYSRLSGFAIGKIIHHKQGKGAMKMLEVGAGTGNGTEKVFENTKYLFDTYTFTDISRTFLKKSKKRFSEYPFMEYKLLDFTKDLETQDFSGKSYDLILAVNVLHATDDVMQGLKNLFKLLKDGGALVISEISPPDESVYRFMELTFGLLPSYSSYTDKAVRPRSPLLGADRWVELFRETGFKECIAFPHNKIDNNRGGIVVGFK